MRINAMASVGRVAALLVVGAATIGGCSGNSSAPSPEYGTTSSASTGVLERLFGRKAAAVHDVAATVERLEATARTLASTTSITPSGTGPTAFAIGGAATVIDPGIVVTSPVTLSGCTVGISVGFTSGDELDVDLTGVTGVTKNYDAARGTLTLTGSENAAAYQGVLRKVTFRGTSGTSGKRTFTFGLGPAVANPDNNHFYEYVNFGGTWDQALAHAASRSYFGLQGYLATITSHAENAFVKAKLTSDGWIGARANGTSWSGRYWYWAAGPESGTQICSNTSPGSCVAIGGAFSNFSSGEPNNYNDREDRAQIYVAGGTWNDLPPTNTQSGYLCEYGGMPGDPPLSDFTANITAVYGTVSTAIVLGGTGPSSFVSGAAAQAIDPGLTITTAQTLNGATVGIGTGFVTTDVLDVNLSAHPGISKHYDAARGTLTITGSGNAATYQAILRAVTFRGTSVTTGSRTFTFGLGTAVANRDNDHFYEYVSFSGTWDQAHTNAGTRSYLGLTGYLATLTSAAENDFVKAKLTNNGWIGTRANTTSWSGRYWYWAAGPENGTQICSNTSSGSCVSIGGAFSNWASGEPNNAGGEDRGQMYVAGGTWNDLPPGGTQTGYLCEYGGMAGDPVVILNASVTKTYAYFIADGGTGCTVATGPGVCASGVCSSDNAHCIAANGGCWVDADCTGGEVCSPALKLCVQKATQTLTAATDTGFSQTDRVTKNATPTVRLTLTGTRAAAGDVAKVSNVGSVIGQATITASDLTNGYVDVPLTTALPESGSGGITALGVRWADLTSAQLGSPPYAVNGVITTTLGNVTFTLTNTVGYFGVQTSGGTNYWAAPYQTPYLSPGITQPPTSDIIQFSSAGTRTATFSEAVEGLYFAVVSLNGNGLEFNRDFDIVSQTTVSSGGQGTAGCGFYGCGLLTKSLAPQADGSTRYRLNGTSGEPHGVIRFKGVFSTVSWVALSNETWNGATFGIGATSTELRSVTAGIYTGGGTLVAPATTTSVVVDKTAPGAPPAPTLAAADDTGLSSSDHLTHKTTGLTFSTTVEAGSYCTLFDDANANGAMDAGESLVVDVLSPTVTLATQVNLANGAHKVHVFCTDLAGNVGAVSAVRSVTIGPVPGAPAITAFAPDSGTLGDGVTSARTLTITGTALAGSTVTVRNGATTLGTSVATAGGTFSFTTAQLGFGSHAFTATATGVDLTSSPASAALDVVVQAPAGQGSCTTANAAIMCFSGTCNPTTGVCALPPGSPCTSNAQCVNGVCGVNGQCGLADGQSGCTAQTGATLCQSGVCSSDNVHCMPATGGCYGNGDCANGEQCNLATLACELAPAIATSAGDSNFEAGGAAVRVDPALTVVGAPTIGGATVTVSGAFVAAQDRLNFAPVNGITGSYNQATGVLTLSGNASSAAYQGALRSVTYSNTAGNTPNTAQRTITFALGTAVAYAANGHFYEFVGTSGIWSAAKAAAEARTYLGLRGYLATITSQAENDYITAKLSSDGWIGMQASAGGIPRTWSWVTGPESGTIFCDNTAPGTCTARSGRFVFWAPSQPDAYLHSGAPGPEDCGQIYFGSGGRWNDLPSNYALPGYVVEYGGMPGDPQTVLTATKRLNLRAKATMTVATSAQTSTFGNPVTLTATLAPSSVTGTVQFKDGTANLGAPAPIVSGVASLTTSTLSVGNHTISAVYAGDALHQTVTAALSTYQTVVQLRNGQGPCTAADASSVCQSGVCGSNGTCGYGTGDGPCTAQNGSTVCNGGVCGSAGVCIPQIAGGCWVDGDCDASQYCERSSSSCKAKRVAGAAVPNDGLHDGTCTAANAAATCVTGACNAATNTCGVANGTACTAASECASNACSSNGACIPSGPGACWVDSECGPGTYCDRAAFTCTAKLAAGVLIPNDGLHDGACSVQAALAVCASGLCNAALNTCGVASGAACTAPAQCTSNVCAASGACVPTAGACFADTDCSGSQYCERNTFTCRTKLPAGSTIPNDGLHGGTCTPATALAVCLAGACNPLTNTCGLALDAACQDSGECQSNHCARSGRCVPQASSCYMDADCGQGDFCARSTYTCTAKLASGTALPADGLHQTCPAGALNAACVTGRCNAAANTCGAVDTAVCTVGAQCVSNTCATSGRCVPPGGTGCWTDVDCGATLFCDRNSLTCVSDLPNGTPIPSDGIRTGACTPAVAATVCESGACNTTMNTCGGIVGRVCTQASECETNACENGRCGIADGGSGCTPETAYLCQSGACSASANTCVPASGGCYVDSDCAATSYCDRLTLKCVADRAPGLALPNDGLHDGICTTALAEKVCASGVCNAVANTCAATNTAACVFAAECASNVCGANGQCGVPNGSGPCTVATAAVLCQSGRCNANASGAASACIPQGASSCWSDADCVGGEFCHRATFTCTPMLRAGTALPTDGLHETCATDGFNAACSSGRCNVTAGTCAGTNGAPCAAANECVANACGANGSCGLSNGEGTCSAATATSLCQSGECSPQTSVCSPNGGCWLDADCDAAEHCNRTAGSCAPNLARGAAIPTDGIRTGTCTAAAAQAVCLNGGCNATTNTCAAENGVVCTSANQCVANVCGANGKCGLADGQAGCAPGSTSSCQSGACSADGVCIPSSASSCWVDTDCAAAEHCKRDTFTCVADKAAGEPIPSDTLHLGVCNDAVAQSVCASGRCNPVTNTCALVNGGTCALAKECVVNICGSNGRCGLAEGQGPCSSSAATACQSGACSASGVCMPAGKCWADSDCGADQYCKRDTTTCTAKEIAGAPIPSDGLHDGTCTTANAAATCVTGLCNDTTNTCAAAASSACTKPAQCAAGVCGRDGACGIPGGEFCESSAQCRSGTCADGLCTIPGAKIESRGLVECAVGDATPSGGAPSPWAFLVVGAAVLLRRRRGAGDETTTN